MSIIAIAISLAAFAFALRWPWHGLVVLLALLPLNGFIVIVVADLAGLEGGVGRIALAAWHDALAAGVIVAAVVAWIRAPSERRPGITAIEVTAAIVLAVGIVFVFVASHITTALYAYRTLYEPIVLLIAIAALAPTRGMPAIVRRRAARAAVLGGVVAALVAWPQVYLGGFPYLDRFFHEAGERLSPSYLATALAQPRAVGTFNSPNEFGAYLALTVGILSIGGLTGWSARVRAWLLVPVLLALFLTFSRSGWLSTAVVVATLAGLRLREQGLAAARARGRELAGNARAFAPQAAVAICLFVLVVASSRAPAFVDSTISGSDPSAESRPASAAQGARVVYANPLGVGLGMVGPKSIRFGDPGAQPVLASETWWIAYAMQVGVVGLIALVAFVIAVGRELARIPRDPWSRVALAIGLGLCVGALFIPIIDDPSVATPLCAIAGLALAGRRIRDQIAGHAAGPAPDMAPAG